MKLITKKIRNLYKHFNIIYSLQKQNNDLQNEINELNSFINSSGHNIDEYSQLYHRLSDWQCFAIDLQEALLGHGIAEEAGTFDEFKCIDKIEEMKNKIYSSEEEIRVLRVSNQSIK